MEYTSLNELISYLKYGTKLNICVVFLNDNGNFKTKLPTEMAIHTKEYCTYMKSTTAGYKSCVKCRNTALEKAIEDKKAFGGLCFKGVYEYCYPVCEGDDVIAVIFVGNIFPKNPDEKIYEFEDTFEKSFDEKKCDDICKIIENQIKLLIKEYSNIKTEYNPLISNIINFIAESYTTDIYVSDISKIFGYNEKYIGKLFIKHTGQTIKEYLNEKRLNHASSLLKSTKLSITEIASKCGFNNVTYFNRLFKEKYNMSPNKYRE
ncbi:MAG: helix-turn-helix domain-containing protein [Ruminococcaceae bacterium]|nr:helix-turn-helix domain-containing protein [Oscillospiraceae bacterium]